VRKLKLPFRDMEDKVCKIKFDKYSVMTKARIVCDSFVFVLRMKKDGEEKLKTC